MTPSPYTPPTRQLAPAPPQLTRSYSSPFPPVTPSFSEQKERERMSEKGLGTPTAAYLSRKLSLSNYVAPSASASASARQHSAAGRFFRAALRKQRW